MARNRVIYQSEALFVSPNATGAHFSVTQLLSGSYTGADRLQAQLGDIPGGGVGLRSDPALTINNIADIPTSASEGAADIKALSGIYVDAIGMNYDTPINSSAVGTSGGYRLFTDPSDYNTLLINQSAVARSESHATGVLLQPFSGTYQNQVQQIHRVQSANYSFSINRTDVNTFGTLARIDAIVLEPPTVSLDFSYYPTDGFNERLLGFYVQGLDSDGVGAGMGVQQLNAVSGHLQDDGAGRNFFILTTPEGTDAFNTTRAISDRSVIGLGNGFLSDWSLDASVGSIPNASATIELFNAKSDIGTTGIGIPSVSLQDGSAIGDTTFSLGHPASMRGDSNGASPSTGDVTATALRPGDITLEIPAAASIFSDVSGDGGIHIQNFSLSVPLSRTPIDRLGTRFAFSRVVDFPVVSTLSVSALVSEIGTGNLASILDGCEEHDLKITMKANASCGVGAPVNSMIIDFKGARLDSESMSSDIGSNKSVDLSFTAQIGGPEDTERGVFISGANRTVVPNWYPEAGR